MSAQPRRDGRRRAAADEPSDEASDDPDVTSSAQEDTPPRAASTRRSGTAANRDGGCDWARAEPAQEAIARGEELDTDASMELNLNAAIRTSHAISRIRPQALPDHALGRTGNVVPLHAQQQETPPLQAKPAGLPAVTAISSLDDSHRFGAAKAVDMLGWKVGEVLHSEVLDGRIVIRASLPAEPAHEPVRLAARKQIRLGASAVSALREISAHASLGGDSSEMPSDDDEARGHMTDARSAPGDRHHRWRNKNSRAKPLGKALHRHGLPPALLSCLSTLRVQPARKCQSCVAFLCPSTLE